MGTNGSREALIKRLFDASRGRQGHVDLPENIRSSSEENLAAVCASHGLHGLTSREERLDALAELQLEAKRPALKDKAKAAAVKNKGKVFALKDKNYLKKHGQKVCSASSVAASNGKAKAKSIVAATKPTKRRKVVHDD